MSCVNPNRTAYWGIDMRDSEGTIRVEVTRAVECGARGSDEVACRQQMQRTPRVQNIAIKSDGNRQCGIVAS
jgi:hypothetical protein